MRKKLLLMAAFAGLFLASCKEDEAFDTLDSGTATVAEEIGFGTNVPNLTRADYTGKDAAEKLNNNFIVYGFKYYEDEEPWTAADVANTDKQQNVFTGYNVSYEAGTAGSTKSNTANWEYVGKGTDFEGDEQTIKYWDYSTKGYVFSAVSSDVTGLVAEKTAAGTTNKYEKGWTITLPAGATSNDLSTLYASARKPEVATAAAAGAKKTYPETVTLTFYSMVTKIRFAVYETVPGYSVKIDKFYYDKLDDNDATTHAWDNSTSNFAITGNFRTPNTLATTPLTITYYDNTTAIENRPKVTIDETNVEKSVYQLFGGNIQATSAIGTTSVEATYDQASGAYTCILPYQQADNVLKLYVDYTLTAPNGETIKVYHASATVPAEYTQWKENFAYTYLFKISDKTNGSTGTPEDKDDPEDTPDDTPEGLYPITFDACVVSTDDGVQETITSVAKPSITTYQNGQIVTVNNEYTAGDVYFNVMKDGALQALTNKAEVYEIHKFDTSIEDITESVVAEWQNNDCVLIPVAANTAVTAVPMYDGTAQAFTADYLGVFQAQAGKTYGIYYAPDQAWKIVKVAGTEATHTYTLAANDTDKDKITTQTENAVLKLTSSSPVDNTIVIGALRNIKVMNGAEDVTSNFTITDNYDGTYSFQLTDAAIKAGADGTYTVKFADKATCDITVNLHYVFRKANAASALTNNTLNVIAGKSESFRLSTGQPSNVTYISGAVIENTNTGIEVEESNTKPGTYTVTVEPTVAANNYAVTVAGKTLTIEVTSYKFNPNAVTLAWAENGAAPTTKIDLWWKIGTGSDTENTTNNDAFNSSDDQVIANGYMTSGDLTITALKGGKTTLSYENASCEVTVNKYELISTVQTIEETTGSTVLALLCNDAVETPVESNFVVSYYDAANSAWITPASTTDYSLVKNGNEMIFSKAIAGKWRIRYRINGEYVGKEDITVQ